MIGSGPYTPLHLIPRRPWNCAVCGGPPVHEDDRQYGTCSPCGRSSAAQRERKAQERERNEERRGRR